MLISKGERLGPYEIVSLIGKGGMGEVWRARDSRVGRDVAVKISEQRFSEPFEREARAIASLNHPNIFTLFDVGPNYLVMELVDGSTLAEWIAQGPVPLKQAVNIAKQIAEALEAAHCEAIVHRDLKPDGLTFCGIDRFIVSGSSGTSRLRNEVSGRPTSVRAGRPAAIEDIPGRARSRGHALPQACASTLSRR
jgi:serine/threonine protein kinase